MTVQACTNNPLLNSPQSIHYMSSDTAGIPGLRAGMADSKWDKNEHRGGRVPGPDGT